MIIGRSQFFTENTLYPVMLSLRHPEHFSRTARLWAIVFPMNLVGAFIFAMLAVLTGALADPIQSEIVSNGVKYTDGSFIDTFWSAVIVGFLLATVAWLVEGCDTVTGRVAVIWSPHLLRVPREPRPLHRDHGHGLRGAARRGAERR